MSLMSDGVSCLLWYWCDGHACGGGVHGHADGIVQVRGVIDAASTPSGCELTFNPATAKSDDPTRTRSVRGKFDEMFIYHPWHSRYHVSVACDGNVKASRTLWQHEIGREPINLGQIAL